MEGDAPGEVTRLLNRLRGGDKRAESKLITLVHDELRKLAAAYMRRERADHTLQPTALVNEAYVRLAAQKEVNWQSRAHFFAVAAQVMRRVLVDYARNRLAQKRRGRRNSISLDQAYVFSEDRSSDFLALNEALTRLEKRDERTYRVIELRFFAGLSVNETAEVLGVSARTVKREWNFGRAWLLGQLKGGAGEHGDAVGPS